jgi:hypothetical protein
MKNLAIGFCSFRPEQYPVNVRNLREIEYLNCIKQLIRILPDSFDLIIVDNTVKSINDIENEELSILLKNMNFMSLGSNIGTQNKGMGELQMLDFVLKSTDLLDYNVITYVTARRLFTCPYFFEKSESLSKEALLCNPDFVYLNGTFLESEKNNMFNDMIFSMKKEIMVKYSDYSISQINNNLSNNVGSEQNLCNFVTSTNIDFEWSKWIGLIRHDWMLDFNKNNINLIHIC